MHKHPTHYFAPLSRLVPLVFFIGLLVIGLMLFPDYGVSLDEPAQRFIGIVNLNYLAGLFQIQSILGNPYFENFSTQTLHQIKDRHYGVIFELPAAYLEYLFDLRDERSVYLYRHAFTFLFFFKFLFPYTLIFFRLLRRFFRFNNLNFRLFFIICVLIS